jgi:hypothetical protein
MIKSKIIFMSEQKCEVHNYLLRPATVPIHYGLIHIDDEFIDAREKLFPNAKTSVMGGCVFEDESEVELLVCEKCRETEIEWRDKNNRREQTIGEIRI